VVILRVDLSQVENREQTTGFEQTGQPMYLGPWIDPVRTGGREHRVDDRATREDVPGRLTSTGTDCDNVGMVARHSEEIDELRRRATRPSRVSYIGGVRHDAPSEVEVGGLPSMTVILVSAPGTWTNRSGSVVDNISRAGPATESQSLKWLG
jgi:hypothetical protein